MGQSLRLFALKDEKVAELFDSGKVVDGLFQTIQDLCSWSVVTDNIEYEAIEQFENAVAAAEQALTPKWAQSIKAMASGGQIAEADPIAMMEKMKESPDFQAIIQQMMAGGDPMRAMAEGQALAEGRTEGIRILHEQYGMGVWALSAAAIQAAAKSVESVQPIGHAEDVFSGLQRAESEGKALVILLL